MPTNNIWNSQNPGQVSVGMTGKVSVTAYAPICGGTTGTAALQSTTLGASGTVLLSTGSSSLPTFQAASSGVTFGYKAASFYQCSFAYATSVSTSAVIADRLYLQPFYINSAITINAISCKITAVGGGGNFRLGIYNVSGGLPTTVFLDSGSTAVSAITQTIPVSTTLAANTFYYAALHCSSTPTLQRFDNDDLGNQLFPIAQGTAFQRTIVSTYYYASAYAGGFPDLTGVALVSDTSTTAYNWSIQVTTV